MTNIDKWTKLLWRLEDTGGSATGFRYAMREAYIAGDITKEDIYLIYKAFFEGVHPNSERNHIRALMARQKVIDNRNYL